MNMDFGESIRVLSGILNSDFFQSAVTLGVGFVALYIYRKQHVDEKRNAAQTIYNEISSAENKLKGVRERFFASEKPQLEGSLILPYENWNRYKYLFVNDLTSDEWDLIDNFYSNCKTYDQAITLNNSYFHERTKLIAEDSFKYLKDAVEEFRKVNKKDKNMPQPTINDIYDYQDVMIENALTTYYKPKKPFNDARIALVALETTASLSSAGQKLSQIATPPKFFNFKRK